MPESKSTCRHSASALGQYSETLVQEFFENQNYQLKARNQKYCGVELDLVFYKNHWVVVEVKSLRCWDEMHFRLGPKQKQRLQFACHALQDRTGELVELFFAFVVRGEIKVIGAAEVL